MASRTGAPEIFGSVVDLHKNENSSTGYSARLLINGLVEEVDVIHSIYARKEDPYYFFPELGESIYKFVFHANGTLVDMVSITEMADAAGLSYGVPRTLGSTWRFEGRKLIIDGFDEEMESGRLAYYYNYRNGTMPEIHDGLEFTLADDCCFYVFDWTKQDHYYFPVSYERYKKVIAQNGYWGYLYSFPATGNPYVINLCCTNLNYKKDPNQLGGNIPAQGKSKDELTGAEYEFKE